MGNHSTTSLFLFVLGPLFVGVSLAFGASYTDSFLLGIWFGVLAIAAKDL